MEEWKKEIVARIFSIENLKLVMIFLVGGMVFFGVVWYVPPFYSFFQDWNLSTVYLPFIGELLVSAGLFYLVRRVMNLSYSGLAFIILIIPFLIGEDIGSRFVFATGPFVPECEGSNFFSERADCYRNKAMQSEDAAYCNSITAWAFTYPILPGGRLTVRNNQPPLVGRDFCYYKLATKLEKIELCSKARFYFNECIADIPKILS